MRMTRKFVPLVLASLIAVPGWAGDDDHKYAKKKCSAETDMCVHGMVEMLSKKGWIGIEWEDEAEIPALTLVFEGSPAASAGLLRGDKVLAFDGVSTTVDDEKMWGEIKKSLVPGNTITLTIERAGVKKDIDVSLVPLPRHVMAQWIGNHVLDHHHQMAENTGADEAEDEASP